MIPQLANEFKIRFGRDSGGLIRPYRTGEAETIVVIEKCMAVGIGGIVSDGVRKALSGVQLRGYTVIAGLGGRAQDRAADAGHHPATLHCGSCAAECLCGAIKMTPKTI